MSTSAAGAVVFDHRGRLLLIRRGREPGLGQWSIPGGKCRPDESTEAACVREVVEETGLVVDVLAWLGRVELAGPEQQPAYYVVDDYRCRWVGGTLRAGDDATAAGWFDLASLNGLDLVIGLRDTLAGWDALPR